MAGRIRIERSGIHCGNAITVAIARKEVIQIRRDQATTYLVFVFPPMLLVLYGFGIRYADMADTIKDLAMMGIVPHEYAENVRRGNRWQSSIACRRHPFGGDRLPDASLMDAAGIFGFPVPIVGSIFPLFGYVSFLL